MRYGRCRARIASAWQRARCLAPPKSFAQPENAESRASDATGSGARRRGVSRQVGGGFGAAGDLELGEDAGDIVLDRLLGQVQLVSDLAVRPPLGDHLEDALFLGPEAGPPVVPERAPAPSASAGGP